MKSSYIFRSRDGKELMINSDDPYLILKTIWYRLKGYRIIGTVNWTATTKGKGGKVKSE